MEIKGLKKLRNNPVAKEMMFECKNCRCKRYSPCGCKRRK